MPSHDPVGECPKCDNGFVDREGWCDECDTQTVPECPNCGSMRDEDGWCDECDSDDWDDDYEDDDDEEAESFTQGLQPDSTQDEDSPNA